MNEITSTSNCLVLSTEASADVVPVVESPGTAPRAKHYSEKNLENAIYAYIQAIRALGRMTVNTSQIADGLSLNIHEVNRAVSSLKRRGVRALGV
jgi:hypothetical protein